MFTLIRIFGEVPAGPLKEPTQIIIVGSFTCPGGSGGVPIELKVTSPAGAPATPSQTTTSTGASGEPPIDSFTIIIPAWALATCGTKITFDVRAKCGGQWTAWETSSGVIECLCPRIISLLASYGTCIGTPPQQNVTFTAEIILPPKFTWKFKWVFGDGNILWDSATNQTTDWNNQLTVSTTHQYDPSQKYTACLEPQEGCANESFACVKVYPDCSTQDGCPTVNIEQPQVNDQCINGKRNVTLTAHITAQTFPTIVQWNFGDGSLGQGFGPNSGPPSTPNPSIWADSHDYAPGRYTAQLIVIYPANCQVLTVDVDVPACEDQCTLVIDKITFQVGPCNPDGTRTVTATAVLNSNDPGDQFYWQWDNNPAQGPGVGLSQPHDYNASGTGTNQYNVTLMVVRRNCFYTLNKQVSFDGCGSCPTIENLMIDVSSDCTPDRLRRLVNLNAIVLGTGISEFRWDCGDGTIQTLAGSAGPQAYHEYVPGTYHVSLTAIGPDNCEVYADTTITVEQCCPELTGIGVSAGACASGTTTRPVTLNAQVAGTGASTFEWDFGDGSPAFGPATAAPPPHNYSAPGSYTASVKMRTQNCPDSSATTNVNVASCTDSSSNSSSTGCAALLWTAIGFIVAGAFMVVIGCVLDHFGVEAGVILQIVGLGLAILGWTLLGLWYLICSKLTACQTILAVRTFVGILIIIFAIIGVVLVILSLLGFSSLVCAGYALACSANWGLVYRIINGVAEMLGCLILNPSGGSSSSALLSRGPSRAVSMRGKESENVSQLSDRTGQETRGLGDVVKQVTNAFGIKPCAKCEERAQRLNRWAGFGGDSF